jgi:hypothetical protein
VFNERGDATFKIVTPLALANAREHFACPTLNGVELEQGGGSVPHPGLSDPNFDIPY